MAITHTQPNRDQRWLDAWYGNRRWTLWLMPFMWLFILGAACRRWWVLRYRQKKLAIPVIVVGNISVGGTGKTPLLIALVKHFQQQGLTPGVISRGYGGAAPHYPYLLDQTSTAREAGDEPISIFQQTACAVCVGPDRIAAGKMLEDLSCDILLSDDGLQHYRLGRDIEIAVVDGQRGLGNGFRLPVGPLRESANRLKTVDWIVVNSADEHFQLPLMDDVFFIPMQIKTLALVNLQSGIATPVATLAHQRVHAVAGIGNPTRFYTTLSAQAIQYVGHSFPDHYVYSAADFQFADNVPVIMTEKDAVKCRSFAQPNWYYLQIVADLPESFWIALTQKIDKILQRQKTFQQPLKRK